MKEQTPLTPDENTEIASTPEPWTPETITKLLFLSFRHSQGNPVLQEDLFVYIRSRQEAFTIPPKWETPVKTKLKEIIDSYFGAIKKNWTTAPYHKPINPIMIAPYINIAFEDLKNAFAQAEITVSQDELLAKIIGQMMMRDMKYLVRGRPRKGRWHKKDPIYYRRDFSYFEHYAGGQHPTGLAIFDDMYRDMREYLLRRSKIQEETAREEKSSPDENEPE
jgi:hypothetical protein